MDEPVDGLSAGALRGPGGAGRRLGGFSLARFDAARQSASVAGAGDVRGSCEGQRGGGERGRTAGGRRRVSLLRPPLCEITTEIEIG